MEKLLTKEVISTICIIVLSVLIYLGIKKIITKVLMKKAKESESKKTLTVLTVITNACKYLFLILALLMVLDVWGVNTKALIASLGVVGAVAGLAFQDLLKDFISGTSILTENQFKVGDNIKIGDFRGDVISLGMKTTRIRAYTGEVKIISNRNITEVINYSIKPIRVLIDLNLSYDADSKKINDTLKSICDKVQAQTKYLRSPMQVIGINEFTSGGITYRAAVEVAPGHELEVKRLFLNEMKKEFDNNTFQVNYTTMDIHNV